MIKKSLLLITAIVSVSAIASCSNLANSGQTSIETADIADVEVAANQSLNYQDYAEVLQTYVSNEGLVDYEALQANREQLDRFNQSLGTISLATYESWSEAEQIAFLTNAYNSFTLQSIIDREPLDDSIRDIPGVWKRRKFALAGRELTLDNIEHDILRKDFNEPRIHVALVCAAISCPPLRTEPYLPEKLDAQLEDQTIKFAQSPHGFKLDRQENSVYISSIYKWFGEDFEPTYGIEDKFQGNNKQRAVLNYISPVLDSKDLEFLEQGDYRVRYLNYDWSLNKQ